MTSTRGDAETKEGVSVGGGWLGGRLAGWVGGWVGAWNSSAWARYCNIGATAVGPARFERARLCRTRHGLRCPPPQGLLAIVGRRRRGGRNACSLMRIDKILCRP